MPNLFPCVCIYVCMNAFVRVCVCVSVNLDISAMRNMKAGFFDWHYIYQKG